MQRTSGTLLHISSLPGEYGIGRIGHHAHEFIHMLKAMGQSHWQILPLGPTGYGNSPYQALSSFAANELFISVDALIFNGLIKPNDAEQARVKNDSQVDFGTVIDLNNKILDQVARDFNKKAASQMQYHFAEFCHQQSHWLDDYAQFMVIKRQQQQKPWYQWPDVLKHRHANALEQIRISLNDEIERIKLGQFLFYSQWQALRATAKQANIKFIGDMPIFIAHDSADSWCHPELLLLDHDGQCTVVAGVPPDYFSKTGQRWGNPLYDWPKHIDQDFSWWFKRLDHAFSQTDLVRIDHFRGFQAYWEIQASEPTAIKGRWIKAPGRALFARYLADRPQSPLIAEDLGVITAEVKKLISHFNFPSMRVLQFAFDNDLQNPHLPVNHPENCVAYTSTHDNNTLLGWLNDEQPHQAITKVSALANDEISVKRLINMVMQSKAQTAIVPMQDLLFLDTTNRMNTPATTENNWIWRLTQDQTKPENFDFFVELTQKSGRFNPIQH